MFGISAFDLIVLFEDLTRGRSIWKEVFETDALTTTLGVGGMEWLATLSDQVIPSDILDLRWVGTDFNVGECFIGLNFDAALPFKNNARMLEILRVVCTLLGLGGHAVILTGAAMCVKSKDHFLQQAGNLEDVKAWPFMAWLDTIATVEECQSYGLPRYFGAPNVRAIVPAKDRYSLERSMQAVRYMSGRLSATHSLAEEMETVRVPIWFHAGREIPPLSQLDQEFVEWEATLVVEWEANLAESKRVLTLRAPHMLVQHPGRIGFGNAGFDAYSRGVADVLLERVSSYGMNEVDAVEFRAEGQPEVRLLIYEGRGLYVFATAGFGRVEAQSGRPEFGTVHAEFCLFSPLDDPRLESLLLTIGDVALNTPVEGGLKDYDSIPLTEEWSLFLVPMEDLQLGPAVLPLRMVVLVTASELNEIRSAENRRQWYEVHLSTNSTAPRWTEFLGRSS